MTHLHEDDLTLLYYGELPSREALEAQAHLSGCAECRRHNDDLLRLFAMVNRAPVPEPDSGYEAAVWRRLQPALRAARETRRGGFGERLRAWLVPSRGSAWAAAGALAALVIVAFIAGRFWPAGDPLQPAAPAGLEASGESLRERILLTALEDHFDRSQIVLVELASADPAATVDISGEQRRAADLLSATRLYRQAAVEAGDRGVADILEALGRVLTEVTLSPPTLTAYELQSLQHRIEEQELLFKLRVAASTVRQRETETRPEARGSAGV
jgi:hypothetical protein